MNRALKQPVPPKKANLKRNVSNPIDQRDTAMQKKKKKVTTSKLSLEAEVEAIIRSERNI